MDSAMTIEQFNYLLKAEETGNSLLAAIFNLTTVENPDDLVKAIDDQMGWGGW